MVVNLKIPWTDTYFTQTPNCACGWRSDKHGVEVSNGGPEHIEFHLYAEKEMCLELIEKLGGRLTDLHDMTVTNGWGVCEKYANECDCEDARLIRGEI